MLFVSLAKFATLIVHTMEQSITRWVSEMEFVRNRHNMGGIMTTQMNSLVLSDAYSTKQQIIYLFLINLVHPNFWH